MGKKAKTNVYQEGLVRFWVGFFPYFFQEKKKRKLYQSLKVYIVCFCFSPFFSLPFLCRQLAGFISRNCLLWQYFSDETWPKK